MTTTDLLILAEGWPQEPIKYTVKPSNRLAVIIHLIAFRNQFSEN